MILALCFRWFHARLIFATESYGGHFGPSFITFFNEQNSRIDAGEITGEKITISALMINKWVNFVKFCWAGLKKCSGRFDPLQNKALVDFVTNAPRFGQLQNDTVIKQMNQAYYGPGGCKEQGEACLAAGESDASNEICSAADDFCVSYNVNRHRDTLFKILFQGGFCAWSCNWWSRPVRSQAKSSGAFPSWLLHRLP